MNTVNMVSIAEVIDAVEAAGFKWIASRNYSDHPGDWYLKVVMGYRESNHEWAVWLYNAERKGLNEGYYTESNTIATNKYNSKR